MFGRRANHRSSAIERELFPHLEALHGYALYLTRQREQAEELTQETLLKAVNSFHQYQPGTNCKAWLFRIMHNTWLNALRKRRPEVELDDQLLDANTREDLAAFGQANRTPEESFVSQMSRSRVREAIEKLPDEFRAVVVLADLEELSYKEIAEVLSCPIGTVMSRLHRGRKMLRQRLFRWAQEMGLVAEPAEAAAPAAESGCDNITPLALYRERPGRTEERS